MTSFVAYVDESGDEGFTFRSDGSGSSRWFVMSALVLRKANDIQAVKVAREIRQLLAKPVNHPLHFRNLRHEQRIPVSRSIGQMSARTVSILIHKPSIEEPEIFQQQPYALCRYVSRLLLERVSWLCRDNRRTDDGDGRAELVFSNRSAMSYDDLRQYLNGLKQEREGRDVRIDWNAIDPSRVRAVNHDQLAGLQLADAVATSAYYSVAVNRYGDVEDRYLRSISPTIYRRDGRVEGYGLKFWCSDRSLVERVIGLVD